MWEEKETSVYIGSETSSSICALCIFNYVPSSANYLWVSHRLDYLPNFQEPCSIDKNL